jgi:hypothetical protein
MRNTGRFSSWLSAAYGRAFYTSPRLSGIYPALPPSEPGQIDRLWGGDMAFRKKIFQDHHFDERLQKYGGYAFGEDQLFSHRLHRQGFILSIAEEGLVIHRTTPGARRGNPFNKGRMEGYNAGIVWRTSIFPYAPWSVIFFVWARIGFMGVVLLPCLCQPWQSMRWKRMAGYLAGLWVFMLEEIRGHTSAQAPESPRSDVLSRSDPS